MVQGQYLPGLQEFRVVCYVAIVTQKNLGILIRKLTLQKSTWMKISFMVVYKRSEGTISGEPKKNLCWGTYVGAYWL